MTLDQAIKIQSIVDKRATAFDTLEFLDEERFSQSKQSMTRYGDMHLDHFFRVCASEILDDPYIEDAIKMEVPKNITEKEMFDRVKEKIIKEFFHANN